MQQAVANQASPQRQEFDGRDVPINEPGWLGERRLAAIERFEQVGLPHRKLEAWRNTDLNSLKQQHFSVALAPEKPAPRDGFALPDAYRLVFLDGYQQPTWSALGGLPSGVHVLPLSMALYQQLPVLEQHYGKHLDADHPFAALNTAFANDGVLVHLGAGVVLDKPLMLEFICSEAGGHAIYPRIMIIAETGAEAEIIEYYRGPQDAAYLCSPATEVVVGANAGINWYKLQEEGQGAFHIATLAADLGRDARFKAHSFASGGRVARTELTVNLNAEGADAQLNGLYLTREGQFSDHHTLVDHRAGHCNSQQRFKGILSGKSEAVYDGLVRVAHGAAKTDAQQENRNLLLSRRALAHSNPRLEIYTDDVKCSHGSTIGELDRDALFYLRSRGLGEEAAQALLTFAFAEELLTPIGIEALREYEHRALSALLPGSETIREMP